MLGVTFFGLFLTPVFYVVIRWFAERRREKPEPSSNHFGTVGAVALVPCLLGLLSGCVVGPDYKVPQTQMPEAYTNQAQEGVSTDGVETLWWRDFQDDRLNQLVELALANNHDLRVATARLREARALRSETEFDRYPTVTIALLEGGRGTELDTSRAEAQLQSTLASIPRLETASKAAMYRLGVLIGQPPTTPEPELSEPQPLPALPTHIALGRPEDLLRRRPDIRATERHLAAATARVGVETADLFPRVTLAGSIALQTTSFLGLGDRPVIPSRLVLASFGRRSTWDVCGLASGPPMRKPRRPWRNTNSASYWPSKTRKIPWSISPAGRHAATRCGPRRRRVRRHRTWRGSGINSGWQTFSPSSTPNVPSWQPRISSRTVKP
jgi:Outer membrane efflux protein